jgi:hypothetical protein
MVRGSAADVVEVWTSLTDNLNKAPFVGNPSKYTNSSPAVSDPNRADWEYRMMYSVVVNAAAFGSNGFGSVTVLETHNSPAKRAYGGLKTCGPCVTNEAVAIAFADTAYLTRKARAKVCLVQPPPPTTCVPATYDFSGSSQSCGTAGNIREFSAGGVAVRVSAFSRTTNGTWAAAYLGRYSAGLGVTDTSEGNGDNNRHVVDNVGRYNYVLFEFAEPVIVTQAYLDYVLGDSDIAVWIGSGSDPFHQHLTLSDAVLAGLSREDSLASDGNARWASFNAGDAMGNVLVIAALPGGSLNDQFKLHKLGVCVPETAGGGYCPHTPAYWRNQTADWPAGYAPSQTVGSVFSAASLYWGAASKSLVTALEGKAGWDTDVRNLLRAGVAAALNAASADIAYPYTEAQVIDAVNQALTSGQRSAMSSLATLLDQANNQTQGCRPADSGSSSCGDGGDDDDDDDDDD